MAFQIEGFDEVCLSSLTAGAHALGQGIENSEGAFPVYAGVRYAHAVLQLSAVSAFLIAAVDIAFNHDGADVVISRCELSCYGFGYQVLVLPLFVAIAV